MFVDEFLSVAYTSNTVRVVCARETFFGRWNNIARIHKRTMTKTMARIVFLLVELSFIYSKPIYFLHRAWSSHRIPSLLPHLLLLLLFTLKLFPFFHSTFLFL